MQLLSGTFVIIYIFLFLLYSIIIVNNLYQFNSRKDSEFLQNWIDDYKDCDFTDEEKLYDCNIYRPSQVAVGHPEWIAVIGNTVY